MEMERPPSNPNPADGIRIHGFVTVHVQRWTGPRWAAPKGHPLLTRLMRRIALWTMGRDRCYGPWELVSAKPNKVINKGRDDLHSLSWAYNPGLKGFQIMAMGSGTASCTAALATVPSETSGSGVGRATTTRTHTTGTNKSTLVKSFTASGACTVRRMALYNSTAKGSGDMAICNSFTAVTLAANDVIKITETITMGAIILILPPKLLPWLMGSVTIIYMLRLLRHRAHERNPSRRTAR